MKYDIKKSPEVLDKQFDHDHLRRYHVRVGPQELFSVLCCMSSRLLCSAASVAATYVMLFKKHVTEI
jgi:hypothetical protein